MWLRRSPDTDWRWWPWLDQRSGDRDVYTGPYRFQGSHVAQLRGRLAAGAAAARQASSWGVSTFHLFTPSFLLPSLLC